MVDSFKKTKYLVIDKKGNVDNSSQEFDEFIGNNQELSFDLVNLYVAVSRNVFLYHNQDELSIYMVLPRYLTLEQQLCVNKYVSILNSTGLRLWEAFYENEDTREVVSRPVLEVGMDGNNASKLYRFLDNRKR